MCNFFLSLTGCLRACLSVVYSKLTEPNADDERCNLSYVID